MASPVRVYDRKLDIAFTAEQIESIRCEAAMRGITVSDVIRDAVERHLAARKAS